uniref:Uncharacterized protein n=1 Tax=Amphora coffeiformis TaxID=265554 RepID=A0A7S3P1T7_9STRA|mmetsp:Transcript_23528/g.44744  ORF Transcript_23528/g.44744 Transcript_23528/m.44744 type:complete len:142 (-) Transcript_23528:91-516(-)
MFAVKSGIQRSMAPAARRLASVSAAPKNKLVPDMYQYNFNKSWFSDPSTYPLIAVMALATTVCVGMSANAMLRYRGVKISSDKKNSILNDWDSPNEAQTKITEVITRNPKATHWAGAWKSLRHEGLGVDHEEWKKAKEAQR